MYRSFKIFSCDNSVSSREKKSGLFGKKVFEKYVLFVRCCFSLGLLPFTRENDDGPPFTYSHIKKLRVVI